MENEEEAARVPTPVAAGLQIAVEARERASEEHLMGGKENRTVLTKALGHGVAVPDTTQPPVETLGRSSSMCPLWPLRVLGGIDSCELEQPG